MNVASPGAYVVSDEMGDICSPGEGLFYWDTRHLSRFALTVDGARLMSRGAGVRGSRVEALVADNGEEKLRILRWRTLGSGMFDEILLTNESGMAVEAVVSIECAADFEDVFAVRGFAEALKRGDLRGDIRRRSALRLSAGWILSRHGGARFCGRCGDGCGAGQERLVRVSVELEEGGEKVMGVEHAPLYAGAPELETDWASLRKSWEKSVEDLESLTFDAGDGLLVPAAGTPWFMALFGRDSLITAYQAMVLSPEPARNVLRALARHQAKKRDDFTDAEPGKIPHELRRREMAFFGEIPDTPYYGTADATPLFLILLQELWRWTGGDEFSREMEDSARRAVAWVLERLDSDEHDYISYETRSKTGLRNQGWKDSDDAVLFQSGDQAEPPISLCEVQGYTYDALLRTAGLAERVWNDKQFAAGLRDEAEALKDRFGRDFWMEERGYYALALDGEGTQVDSLTSNAGHLLWSGIVPEEKVRAVADRLMCEELFSGWGVRTMAASEGGYGPNSYHNGSVWPHDNAMIAEGLRRYGFRREANRVATALIEAAPHFDYRLPEVFAGYPRGASDGPVEYPTSCSPQAWAAATVPLLVRTMLGLEPDLENRRLTTDPFPKGHPSSPRLTGVAAFGSQHEVEV